MAESPSNYRRTIGKCRIVIIALTVSLIGLIVAFAVVAVHLHRSSGERPEECPTSSSQIHTDQPEIIPPFYDLTPEENTAVRDFLYSQSDLHLVKPTDLRVNESYIFSIELYPPEKQATLDFLDKGGKQPDREAKVVIFKGSEENPVVQEYIVGPLHNPVYKKSFGNPINFSYRPITGPELADAITFLKYELHQNVEHILKESYGGQVQDCGNKCIDVKILSAFPSSESGLVQTRKMWFWLSQDVEFASLHPIDFQVLVDITGKIPSEYFIQKVVYHGQVFDSLQGLATAYEEGKLAITKVPFPIPSETLFSSMHQRGAFVHDTDKRAPEQLEPDGARYSIDGRHVSYMGWDLDIRMSTMFGPQIFDVRFNNERIIYELSLQEIAVFYSAYNPQTRFAAYTDSVTQIGMRSRTLVPGVDCPKHATFLSAAHAFEGSDDLVTHERSFCVFEHNTGLPLRRHVNPNGPKGKFYEGLMDYVLTVRTVVTAVNYDYIVDFIFHQNGAVNVRTISSGYILTSFRYQQEEDFYGWQLRDHVTGNIHHHMFHFKVDLDINGQNNRFETLDIEETNDDNTEWSSERDAKHSQTKFSRNLRTTELKAALQYDFNSPKYLTFYNNEVKTKHGVPRAYRLLMKGMSKQLIERGRGQEPSVSWGRYQLAVTKRNETESRSSSIYSLWDGIKPTVNFQEFIDNDDDIVDEDQVAWVTMGIHHIPHTEDFPVTPTAGLELNFFLLPNNYFDEDPAMASRDSIRIDPVDQLDLSKGVHVHRYRDTEDVKCVPPSSTYDEDANKNPEILFDVPAPGQF